MKTQRLLHHLLMAASAVLLGIGLMPGLAGAQGGTGSPFLGVRITPTADGARIEAIIPDTGAAAAGLQVGDLITALDGAPVDRDHDLSAYIDTHAIGDTVVVTVIRGDETLEIEATLGEEPEDIPDGAASGGGTGTLMTRHYTFAGATFAEVPGGWLVTDVRTDTQADAAGLQEGDQVTTLNGVPVADFSLGRVSGTVADGGEIVLGVVRGDETLDATLELEAGTAINTFQAEVEVTIPTPPDVNRPPLPEQPLLEPEEQNGFLGVSFATLTPDNLASMEAQLDITLSVEEGGLVIEVMPDTPAEEAGLEPGDVITAVNGDVVDAERTLADRISPYEAGDTVTLAVQRGEETLTVEATLIARPPDMREAIVLPMPFDADGLNELFQDNPNLLSEFQALLQAYTRSGDPTALFEFLEEHGLDIPLPMEPLPPSDDESPEGESGGDSGFVVPLPGIGPLMHMFTDPDFDWQAFLDEYPAVGEMMQQMFGEDFDPEAFQQFLEEHPGQMPFGPFMMPFGRGGMHFGFLDPDFDWQTFLEEYPAVGEMMQQMFGEDFDPSQMGEMFPHMPGFGRHHRETETEAAPGMSG